MVVILSEAARAQARAAESKGQNSAYDTLRRI
jgi:hypothetical protein